MQNRELEMGEMRDQQTYDFPSTKSSFDFVHFTFGLHWFTRVYQLVKFGGGMFTLDGGKTNLKKKDLQLKQSGRRRSGEGRAQLDCELFPFLVYFLKWRYPFLFKNKKSMNENGEKGPKIPIRGNCKL
jgi:hypothetical protein